jgi:hypothetical protein
MQVLVVFGFEEGARSEIEVEGRVLRVGGRVNWGLSRNRCCWLTSHVVAVGGDLSRPWKGNPGLGRGEIRVNPRWWYLDGMEVLG